MEDLGKWIKASTVRNAETGPTRDLQSCIDDQIYFLNQHCCTCVVGMTEGLSTVDHPEVALPVPQPGVLETSLSTNGPLSSSL